MNVFSVSVKGVVVRAGRVLLLHNERDEWELPGGRLEIGETPVQCVAREITEETGWHVTAGPILDSWLYYIHQVERHVFIVTYGCHLLPGQETRDPQVSHEHGRVGLFGLDEIADLAMPQGYKASIATWFATLAGRVGDDLILDALTTGEPHDQQPGVVVRPFDPGAGCGWSGKPVIKTVSDTAPRGSGRQAPRRSTPPSGSAAAPTAARSRSASTTPTDRRCGPGLLAAILGVLAQPWPHAGQKGGGWSC